MSNVCLFIGGPLDGQLQRVPSGTNVVQTAKPQPAARAVRAPVESDPPQIEVVNYHRVRLTKDLSVFVEACILREHGDNVVGVLMVRYAAAASEVHRHREGYDQTPPEYGDLMRTYNLSCDLRSHLSATQGFSVRKDF